MFRILVATAVAITVASAGAASAKVRHHRGHMTQSMGMAQPGMGQIGQPGAYGSPGNLTPGYSSTARHKPTDTNAN